MGTRGGNPINPKPQIPNLTLVWASQKLHREASVSELYFRLSIVSWQPWQYQFLQWLRSGTGWLESTCQALHTSSVKPSQRFGAHIKTFRNPSSNFRKAACLTFLKVVTFILIFKNEQKVFIVDYMSIDLTTLEWWYVVTKYILHLLKYWP